MDGAIGSVLLGVWLGWGVAVPIGPVNAEIARRTLRGGFRAGFAVGAGATSVDVGYALVTALALTQIQHMIARPGVRFALGIAGAILLGYFAVGAFIGARRASRTDAFAADAGKLPSARGGFFVGLLLNMLNPWIPTFWFIAVPSQIGSMHQGSAGSLPLLCAGVALGAISWVAFFSGMLSLVGLRHRNRWAIAADLAGGISLGIFAVLGLWRTVAAFL